MKIFFLLLVIFSNHAFSMSSGDCNRAREKLKAGGDFISFLELFKNENPEVNLNVSFSQKIIRGLTFCNYRAAVVVDGKMIHDAVVVENNNISKVKLSANCGTAGFDPVQTNNDTRFMILGKIQETKISEMVHPVNAYRFDIRTGKYVEIDPKEVYCQTEISCDNFSEKALNGKKFFRIFDVALTKNDQMISSDLDFAFVKHCEKIAILILNDKGDILDSVLEKNPANSLFVATPCRQGKKQIDFGILRSLKSRVPLRGYVVSKETSRLTPVEKQLIPKIDCSQDSEGGVAYFGL